jgi:hypothetical protein
LIDSAQFVTHTEKEEDVRELPLNIARRIVFTDDESPRLKIGLSASPHGKSK